jgi:ribonuclease HI
MFWRQKPTGRVWLFCDGSAGAHAAAEEPSAVQSEHELPMTCTAAAIAHANDGRILDWAWQPLPTLTNNEAEYAGLLLGLALAQRLGAQEAICVLDSETVLGQMQGRFAVKSPRLRHWHQRACAAVRALPSVHYVQIPRSWNRLADGLAAQTAMHWPALLTILEKQVKGDLSP